MGKHGDSEDQAKVEQEGSADADAVDVEQSAKETETTETSEVSVLDERVKELQGEIQELTDQLLRKSADFDNYRKRMLREREEFASSANRELLLDLLPIVDDFERAIKSTEDSSDFEALHNGVSMIEKQFVSMLERKWKLTRFDSVGEEFDPQRHEAMMTEERADHDQSMVLEDFQKGYLLNEKVLRPAKVKVSVPVAGGQQSEHEQSVDEAGEQASE
ncbi:MAG: nucleotide exchange factor GrpE [Spirochaetales bacterium]